MDGNSIRRTFIDFFASRAHEVVRSASLIPVDATLLLTGAGMVPFKAYMLGEEPAPYSRAVSIQKCARTTDIDVVGTTRRHLTFFEMLGNFSFGDYFKERAIPWAYELIVEEYGLDPERLWYTVHETDDEAAEIWIDLVGVPPERVQRFDKDNFWQMGVPGPAGPSSEVFFDKGSEYGESGGPAVNDERYMEFWNLVFMQSVQDKPFHVVGDLPAKNIDTGAGLDRFATILQGVDSVFDTDLVRPVMAAAEAACGIRYGDGRQSDISLRIMADHGRAITFLIGDGVIASNEGRGHVLRRLIRRSVRHAYLYGAVEPVMPRLVDATVEVMRETYPELVDRQPYITEMVEREEYAFRRTLASGDQLLEDALARLGEGDTFSGETAFKLHDTYGFPVEVTAEILSERGYGLDRAGFDKAMNEQRHRSREAFKGGDLAAKQDAYLSLLKGIEQTEFTGYEHERGTARALSLVRAGELVERAVVDEPVEVFVDRTPFYAEAGGQVGDSGILVSETGKIRIEDTQFVVTGLNGHRGRVVEGFIQVGQDVEAVIDSERRERIRKNHTGTHLLHWALREVIGEHVHQAGSLVEEARLRFDFSHFESLGPDEIEAVEKLVNERIIENAAVSTVETTKENAERMGALAFFGDRYTESVRVVRAGDYSVEFCGGTHVSTTGQVGPLMVVSEGAVAANTRRMDALTGAAAYEYITTLRAQVRGAERELRAQPGQLVAMATSMAQRMRDYETRIEQFEADSRTQLAEAILETAEDLGDRSVVAATTEGLASRELRALAFQIRDRMGSGIGILGSNQSGKGALVVWVSEDLVADGLSAGDIISRGAVILGGGGSRDRSLAQAGGPKGSEIEEAVNKSAILAREAVIGK